jgi:hypothetical protein
MDTETAIELLMGKYHAYHHGEWESWVACYADAAQVFYNTASEPMSPQEAAEMHAASVVPLAGYAFDEEDDHFEARVIDDGTVEATFYGLWHATFRDTGATIVIPTHVRYWLEDGLIVEEHGFWDNSLYWAESRRGADTQG